MTSPDTKAIELTKDKQEMLAEYNLYKWGDLDIMYFNNCILVKTEDASEWNKRIREVI
jgi:hypothetical protein